MALIKPDDIDIAKETKKTEIQGSEGLKQKEKPIRIKSMTARDQERFLDQMLEYPIPTIYGEFHELTRHKRAIAKNELWLKLQHLTPYLVQRLVYESFLKSNPPSVRVKATQVLIDKILPTVSAEQVNISSDDLQNLVIVKTKTITKEAEEKP